MGQNGEDDKSGGSGFIPNYYDLLGANVDEAEITALAAKALLENRISIKSKGIAVRALDKPQEARNKLQNEVNTNPGQDSGGGLGLEEHPELAEMGGTVDPNIVVLPQSEQEALATNDLDLKLRLLAEYKKKMEMQMKLGIKPEPAPAPRMRPTNAPAPTPRPRPF